MIFASDDVERIYRIQDLRLRKILIKVLQLVKGTNDYNKIDTINEDIFAETVYEVVKSRSSTRSGSLTIADVDRALNSIIDDPDTHFAILYQKCSAVDFKW